MTQPTKLGVRRSAPSRGADSTSPHDPRHAGYPPAPFRTFTANSRDPYRVSTPTLSTHSPGHAEPLTAPMPLRLIDRRPRKSVWLILSLWTIIWSAAQSVGGMYSWHYFVTGGTALVRPGMPGGGLHVYAAHPDLQMGPLTLLIAAIMVALSGPLNAFVAALIMTALGALNVKLLMDLRAHLRHEKASPRSTFYTGLVLIPSWSVLSVHYGHLDDVLALTLTTGAVVAAAQRRPWLTVLLLAAATSAKPWALPFAVLLLLHPVGRTRRVAAYVGLCALPWLPFLLADHRTTSISSFTIVNAPDSALRALGVTAAQTPGWDRMAQVLLAVAIALWCLRIRRAFTIPAVVLAVRMLLDPGTYPYYTCGLVVACLYVDLTDRRRHVPWTAAAVTAWFLIDLLPTSILPPSISGDLRATFLLTLLIVLVAPTGSMSMLRRHITQRSLRATTHRASSGDRRTRTAGNRLNQVRSATHT